MPAQASQSSDLHVSGAEVIINGAQVAPEIRAALVDVRVVETLSLPASATVRITDPEMTHVDSSNLAIGNKLEIKIGAMAARSTVKVFTGEIVAIEPDFSETGCEMVVRALDVSHRLQRGRAVKVYQQQKATDIVSELCREAGLTGSCRATTVQYQAFMRKGETPRELIARFERDYDYRFWLEDGKYKFEPVGSGAASASLKLRENLISFRPRASASEVSDEVVVRGWDPLGKREVSGQASPIVAATKTGGFTANTGKKAYGTAKVFNSARVVDNAGEANALAKALANRKADSIVEAEGTAFGDPSLRAGSKVKIENVGTRFGGDYVMSTVTHTYSGRSGYKTHFRVSGASTRTLLDLMRPPERRDWSAGLVVGIVTNNNDPDTMGRVKVKFPSLPSGSGGDVESAWARIAVLGAGKERGTLMMPQVDEEVVVGFENGDPRRPFVLGSLFNGKDKPGTEMLANKDGSFAVLSNEKAIVHSKKDLELKSDQNMVIEIKSDQKTTVKGSLDQQVTGGAKLKANNTYEIEAGNSMTIKGVNVTVQASASLQLKGATVDVQASGPLTLKGAIINIG